MSKSKVLKENFRGKNGRYGSICTFQSKRLVYVADRKQFQYYRDGRMTISEAVREGVAAWAIDVETLDRVRARGIRYIAVSKKKDRELYVTCIDNFFDRRIAKLINYTSRGGAEQYCLPLQYFHHRIGKTWVMSDLCVRRETPVSSH
jgi:hypothetical protein